jgi:circadian clock protein KaiB
MDETVTESGPGQDDTVYVLRLYVTGLSPRAQDAIRNIRKICEEELHGRYDLKVIDVYQQPELAKKEQILAAPTLIRTLPLPLRRLVGDMSNKEKVVVGLEIAPTRKKGKAGKK